MGKINNARVILGGIVGGVVAFIVDYLIMGWVFRSVWEDLVSKGLVKAASAETLTGEFVIVLAMALIGTYIYALARPRLGGSPKSALRVSTVVGALVGIPAGFGMLVWFTAPAEAGGALLVGSFIVPAVGTFFGAWAYKE